MLPINNGHRPSIYPPGGYIYICAREKDEERYIDSSDIQVDQLGNLLKVLSEFYNAVKVCRLNARHLVRG